MSKRSDYKQEKKPLLTVLYVLAVIVLIGFLLYLVYLSQEKEAAYQENVRQASRNETEFAIKERAPETEVPTEAPAEAPTEAQTRKSFAAGIAGGLQQPATGTQTERKADETEAGVTERTSETTETTENRENAENTGTLRISDYEKQRSILVLNGTQRAGVAGYWKTQLESLGYTHVIAASYNGAVEAHTVIYADRTTNLNGLLETFEGCEFREGEITERIEPGAETLPQKVDVYIVIGKNDAITG